MRYFVGILAGLVLIGSTTSDIRSFDVASDVQQTEAVDVATDAVPAVPDDAPTDLVAELPARRTDDFAMVGVTWRRGGDTAGLEVDVRLRTDGTGGTGGTGGTWGAWQELHVEADEGEVGRAGTEPLWAGDADGVAVRVTSPTGRRPAGLAVTTIDPGTAPVTGVAANSAPARAVASPTYTPKPAIISRSAWGARKNTYCDSPRTGNETRGVVVHHTAGSNGYSRSESASVVRAVQAYHMDGRDWCDIGYNFLVDRYGQVFEGRNGGVDKPVRAAHSGSKAVNTYTMGVAMMGTFSTSQPSSATKSAMVELIGWRLGTTFHPAKGTYGIGTYRLQRIAGHRNVHATACPGAAAYAWLGEAGGLRDRVADYVAGYESDIRTRFRALGADVTGPVYIGEYPFSTGDGGRKARFGRVDMYSSPAGTFSVGDHFRTEYAVLREQSGRLGVPTTSTQATTRSTVRVQRFAGGSIYRVTRASTRAYALFGVLDAKYRSLGQEKSALGAPTRRQTKISGDRQRAWFAKGHLTRQASGVVTVHVS